LAAAAGLMVCGVAGIVSELAYLPSQPGIAAIFGLLVLGAACVRVAPARAAAIIGIGGLAVMVAGRVTARPAYFVVAWVFGRVTLWFVALGVGLWLRSLDTHRRMSIDSARRDERLELARELHDVVAHHITGIVVQAQAARVVGAKHPETMRRVVGLLRDPDDGAATTRWPRAAHRVGRQIRQARPRRGPPPANGEGRANVAARDHHHCLPDCPRGPDQHRQACPRRPDGHRDCHSRPAYGHRRDHGRRPAGHEPAAPPRRVWPGWDARTRRSLSRLLKN